ncbi:ABC transporter permease [Spongiactinospora rosea]|uniref:ABC transporter permease n=1 Tax=Spongiactinospora rosea TaxID=2248750 RepID=A0A366M1P1_9ACTN|nr:ABC transporter permease [Spongiactinospora rosea]RBQ20101.1 ABC transporter permease [Spongiactinospora rosea]
MTGMQTVAGAALRNAHVSRLVALTLLLVVVFSALAPTVFPTALNFQSIAYSVPEIGLLALAMALTMITGGIDLSVVATANLAALTTAGLYIAAGGETATSPLLVVAFCAAALLVGMACGAVNGLLVSRVRVSPILATLATMQIFNGIAILWTDGKAQYGFPDTFLWLGDATIAYVPVVFLIFIGAALLIWHIVSRTGLGTRIVLVGANPVAARYSGVDERGVLMRTYLISGLLAGIAGIVIAAKSTSASPDYGGSYVLLAIVIAVLGGTDPFGGRGSVAGVVLAAIALQVLASGFNIMRLSPFLYQIAQGLILLVVMVVELRRGRLLERLRGLLSGRSG